MMLRRTTRSVALLLSIRSGGAFTRSNALPLRCRALATASGADDAGGRAGGRRRRPAGGGRRRRPSTNQRAPQAGDAPSAAAQKRSAVPLGAVVDVVQKEDQTTGKKTRGVVARHLTRAAQHPRGIKVLLAEEVVGRVVAVLETPEVSDDDLAAFARVSNPQRGRGGGRGRRRRGGGGGGDEARRRGRVSLGR